jgi:hypothetical protein
MHITHTRARARTHTHTHTQTNKQTNKQAYCTSFLISFTASLLCVIFTHNLLFKIKFEVLKAVKMLDIDFVGYDFIWTLGRYERFDETYCPPSSGLL